MNNICIFTGARPNFIKVAPLIRAIHANPRCRYQLVYAGPANDPTLEASLFSDLQIEPPTCFLGVDCQNLNELTGLVMARFEHYLNEHPADTVIVVDDLASTMAAAIVAKKRGLRLAHLVAGTRSFDITMPKEINRLVIDALSDLLFTAGIGASSIATREGADTSKIYLVGNILMDNLRYNRDRWTRPACLDGIADGHYLVLTINRRALLADQQKLLSLLTAILQTAGDVPVIAPLRSSAYALVTTLGAVAAVNSSSPALYSSLRAVPSLGYLDFGYLMLHARGVITDSGNVAEEATFNHVPCITLNSYTEHAETVQPGTNVLVGENPQRLSTELRRLLDGQWKSSALPDRWDGRTAERILQILVG